MGLPSVWLSVLALRACSSPEGGAGVAWPPDRLPHVMVLYIVFDMYVVCQCSALLLVCNHNYQWYSCVSQVAYTAK